MKPFIKRGSYSEPSRDDELESRRVCRKAGPAWKRIRVYPGFVTQDFYSHPGCGISVGLKAMSQKHCSARRSPNHCWPWRCWIREVLRCQLRTAWKAIGGKIIANQGGSHRELITPLAQKIFGIWAHNDKETYGKAYVKYLQTALLYVGLRPSDLAVLSQDID